MARWHIGVQSACDYVVSLDDDLLPVEPTLLERCIEASRANHDSCILGRTGKVLSDGPRYYRDGRGVSASHEEDRTADVVKGRFMFVPVRLLSRVPLYFQGYEGRGDDIWISLWTATGRRAHILPSFVASALREIPDPADRQRGLADDPSHQLKRDMIVADLFARGLPAELAGTSGSRVKHRVHTAYLRLGRRIRGYSDHR